MSLSVGYTYSIVPPTSDLKSLKVEYNENQKYVFFEKGKAFVFEYCRKIKKWVLVVTYIISGIVRSFGPVNLPPISPSQSIGVAPVYLQMTLQQLENRESTKREQALPESIIIVDSAGSKILMPKNQFSKLKEIAFQLYNDEISYDEAIFSLRGGWDDTFWLGFGLSGCFIMIMVYIIGLDLGLEGVEAFQQKLPDGFRHFFARNPFQPPTIIDKYQKCGCGGLQLRGPRSITIIGVGDDAQMERLPKEVIRNMPDKLDRIVKVDDHPTVNCRRGQCKFKVKRHGALAGLEFTTTNRGGTKTLRTEENVTAFQDFLENIITDKTSIWYDDESIYRVRDNDREISAINIYNKEKNVVVVVNKKTGNFITVCQPDKVEKDILLTTGNFIVSPPTGAGQQDKNLPPMTPIDKFSDDVLNVTSTNNHITINLPNSDSSSNSTNTTISKN